MTVRQQRDLPPRDRRQVPRGGRRSTDIPGRYPRLLVADNEESVVLRIDPATGAVEARIHTLFPWPVACGDGGIWVGSNPAGLRRIDPRTNTIVATAHTQDQYVSIAVGGGYAWTADETKGVVYKVDQNGRIVATYEVPASTPAGALQITATFVPSEATGISGSSSSVLTFTVDKAASTTTLTATGSKVKSRGATTYELEMTATITLNTGNPAVGTVTFYAGDTVVGSAAVGTGGTASVTVPATKGSEQVRAEFTPTDTANHLGSTSPTLTVTVK